ncbi:unnamed protein product [Pedinophyceae sp. YPF-701]|nr:unnamed protein product [Pedinophyceae sp. YPF-701]
MYLHLAPCRRRPGRRAAPRCSAQDILRRYRAAYQRPWPRPLRFNGDARDFWQVIVTEAIGSDDPAIFEDIYRYYEKSEAWMVAPGAPEAIQRLKDAGLKLAVVSNFDTRLGKILETVGLANYFDTVVCSAEVEAEKPSPLIFQEALRRLGCEPEEVIHIGDDRRNDLWGARGAGIACLLYGTDARTFNDVADHILSGRPPGDRNLN